MRKEGLENLTLTGHAESKRGRVKQQVNYLSLCEWLLEQGQREMVKSQRILRATKDRALY